MQFVSASCFRSPKCSEFYEDGPLDSRPPLPFYHHIQGGKGKNMKKKCDIGLMFTCVGISLLLCGTFLIFLWPFIFKTILGSKLALSPTSETYELWRVTPIPMHLDFYFFNWTNPEDLLNPEVKPHFVEMGPYRFRETKEKLNITWNSNNTVSYRQRFFWFFDAEHSNGSLLDQVTTLNVLALTASQTVRDWSSIMQYSLQLAISQTQQNYSVTKGVGEMLFDGYDDKLISIAKTFPSMVAVPYDKFGWFYSRNGSSEFDGYFNIDVGGEDVNDFGRIRNWNYKSSTGFYTGECNQLKGSAGEFFPPGLEKDKITFFAPDICRSVNLEYDRSVTLSDIYSHRYVGGLDMVDNGTHNAANECLCNGECSPVGTVNITSCRFGAPAFVSYPHFYLADEFYRNEVDGMKPDRERHEFRMTLEPITAIPIEVLVRLQINVLLQSNPSVSMYANVPRIFFPMAWFENGATITPELADKVKLAVNVFHHGKFISYSLFIIGMIMTIVTVGGKRARLMCKRIKRTSSPVLTSQTPQEKKLVEEKEALMVLGEL